jgi:oxaloacetate decarboxylase gamma subunit
MDTAVVDLLVEGLWLMGIGMAIVFAFLLILVGALVLMSQAVTRWAPEERLPAPPVLDYPTGQAPADDRLIAVITAAVHAYRRRHRS